VTSRTTRKAVVNLSLLVGSAAVLLSIAAAATSLFFWHYLPSQSLSWPVYLQYGYVQLLLVMWRMVTAGDDADDEMAGVEDRGGIPAAPHS
jgi:hypothetical protein